MSRSHLHLDERIPLANPTDEYSHIEVSVFFSRGDTSWVSGDPQPKGIAVSFRGVKVKDDTVSFMMFSGWQRAFIVKAADRYSEKLLRTVWAALDKPALARQFEEKNLDAIRAAIKALAL